jgi:hypothetical protein
MNGEFQPLPGFLEKLHGLLPLYRREVLKKLIDRIARLQAVQERSNQDSRACKDGHPPKDGGITRNDTGNHEPNVFTTLLSVNLIL